MMARMCGRYSLTTPVEAIRALFGFDALPNLAPRYNIAPGQDVAAVRVPASGDGREFTAFRWGLVPSWAKDPAIGNRMINARAETVAEKPSFRAAFRHRRCLIPADGFYEWQKQDKGPKQPYRITLEGGTPFAFAGLWEHWQDPGGDEIETCTIVTTEANDTLTPIHHRMPVILDENAFEAWLAADPKEAGALLQPYRGRIETTPISTLVNKVANDGPEIIEPVAPPGAPGAPGSEDDESGSAQLDLL